MNIVVIGGGPAGMMAAIKASQNKDNKIYLLEKNETLGRKLLITGKGRCNVTSSIDMDEFYKYIPGNNKFLFSAFNNLSNLDLIEMMEENGCKLKEERGNRMFPVSDKAQSVLDTLQRLLEENNNVKVIYGANVLDIKVEDAIVKSVVVEIDKKNRTEILADKIILATGGKTYPLTGSTGDGYILAKKLGHNIIEPKGSLIPLESTGRSLQSCQNMQGVSLKNVKVKVVDTENKKDIYDDFGEMMFTHFGLTGPVILSASTRLIRYKDVDRLLSEGKIKVIIDLKPALDDGKLDDRILRDFSEFKNKEFKNSLDKLLPQKMIGEIVALSEIPEYKKVNEITKEERHRLVDLLKRLEITISGFRPIGEGIVTAGGIDIKEINPKTMESKIVSGLYFAGEIIDVDAITGGFNLQIAFSTGYTAGMEDY